MAAPDAPAVIGIIISLLWKFASIWQHWESRGGGRMARKRKRRRKSTTFFSDK